VPDSVKWRMSSKSLPLRWNTRTLSCDGAMKATHPWKKKYVCSRKARTREADEPERLLRPGTLRSGSRRMQGSLCPRPQVQS
jgi:hypothetical protein